MKLLLTGSTGFLGSALKRKLNNNKLVLTSRSLDYSDESLFFKKNISKDEDFSDCLKNIEVIIHTAARVHQMNDRSKDPLKEFMETNCYGTLNLANQASKAGVKRFIFISSVKVNGEKSDPDQPFKFDDPRQPIDPYGISKAKAEEGLLKIANHSDLEVTIIRPPLVYGPNVKANFASLLNLAKLNIPFPFGSVDNLRSFVSIENLVDLIVTCVNHPKAVNQIFLVSDDDDVSISKLYSLMAEAWGKKPRIFKIKPELLKFIGNIVGKKDVLERLCEDLRVDIWHTKNTLEWAPIVTLEDGIKNCVANTQNEK